MAPAILENLWRATGRRVRVKARAGLGDPIHVSPTLKGLDPCFIDEWAEGWFTIDGLSVALDGRSPFDITAAPNGWAEALHGFAWLVDVPLIPEDDLSAEFRDATRALVFEWLTGFASRAPVARRAEVAARRLISFLAHSDLVLENAGPRLYDLYVRQIGRDAKLLLDEWRALDDEARIVALSGVAQAGLACDGGADFHARAEASLLAELDRQILADGGHLSRDPRVVPALLLDLIPLRQLYAVAGAAPPTMLVDTIARMIEFAGALRLGDGQLTRLAAARPDHDITLPPLTLIGLPPERWVGGASGFARVTAGNTVLIIDAGSDRAPDGALSFEWSAGTVPVVVSAGSTAVLRQTSELAAAARRTRPSSRPAHSTLVADGPLRSDTGTRSPGPSLSQRQQVSVDTIEGIGIRVDVTHAGHSARGFAHRRVIDLAPGGDKMTGQDTLRPLVGPASERAAPLAFHFQLHPDVAVEPLDGGSSVRLSLRDGSAWRFEVMDGQISIEDNVTILNGRAISSIELVIRGSWPDFRTLNWVFEAE